jgi:hypothetical protein
MMIYEEMAEIAQILWQKGWAERNAGNIRFGCPRRLGLVVGGCSSFAGSAEGFCQREYDNRSG